MSKIKEFIDAVSSFLDLPGKIVLFLAAASAIWTRFQEFDPILQIRASALLLIVTLSILTFSFLLPIFLPKLRIKNYGKSTPEYWEKLKKILRDSENDRTSADYNSQYLKYRAKLQEVVAHYQNDILEELAKQRPTANNYAPVVLNNFENCFHAGSLERWNSVCRRNLNEELESFNNLTLLIRKAALK